MLDRSAALINIPKVFTHQGKGCLKKKKNVIHQKNAETPILKPVSKDSKSNNRKAFFAIYGIQHSLNKSLIHDKFGVVFLNAYR